ncbi:MAG TPA: endonuclease/exonuclease/phosphatase family protein [Dongiaceae bacterium]|nr:endonuclease/exonuclease/phosphatase family protein [Dongiaceae bacterium]
MNAIVERALETLPLPDPALLDSAREDAATKARHDALAAEILALNAVEYRPPQADHLLGENLRLAAWNAERLKFGPASAALFTALKPDVLLLSEADIGMARSGNRHTVAELAVALGMGYAYGIEFIELGLGDEREEEWHKGERNAAGFHGNAILSRYPLNDFALIRLDSGGRWFGERPDLNKGPAQRRIGGRMALAARVADGDLVVVSVHLESDSTALDRAAQTERLLAALQLRYGEVPMVIGGDCNTAAFPAEDGRHGWAQRCDVFEPMFRALAEHGFGWADANDMAPTQRRRPDGMPKPPFRRLDWLFTRDVEAGAARTIAAVDEKDGAISDHEVLVVDLAL